MGEFEGQYRVREKGAGEGEWSVRESGVRL